MLSTRTNETAKDKLEAIYPVEQKRPDLITTKSGAPFASITVENIKNGRVDQSDITITVEGLKQQAEIARLAGRKQLAKNFERASELVNVPNAKMIEIYELLRPGRTKSATELHELADELRSTYGAEQIAGFIDEAATVYEKRGLYRKRF